MWHRLPPPPKGGDYSDSSAGIHSARDWSVATERLNLVRGFKRREDALLDNCIFGGGDHRGHSGIYGRCNRGRRCRQTAVFYFPCIVRDLADQSSGTRAQQRLAESARQEAGGDRELVQSG